MSYQNGTVHYNLPQTGDSDTRDWFDSNEAFRAIDTAIYSANQTAEQATQDIEDVKSDITDLEDADTAMTGRVNGIDGRVSTNELKIQRLENATADNKQDLMDAICSIEEASATAAYPHLTSEFFWYNDTLYKATANIAIGQQIVPDTNCKTTNITTELLAGGSGGVEIDDTVVSASKVWSSYKTNEEITSASAAKIGDTRWYSGKIQYYDGSEWVNAEIGGGDMPALDYRNYLHVFTSSAPSDLPSGATYGLTFTATKECYLFGSGRAQTNIMVSVNNRDVCTSSEGGSIYHVDVPIIKLLAGDTVTVSVAPGTGIIAIYEGRVL